jgi:hypothetical protein
VVGGIVGPRPGCEFVPVSRSRYRSISGGLTILLLAGVSIGVFCWAASDAKKIAGPWIMILEKDRKVRARFYEVLERWYEGNLTEQEFANSLNPVLESSQELLKAIQNTGWNGKFPPKRFPSPLNDAELNQSLQELRTSSLAGQSTTSPPMTSKLFGEGLEALLQLRVAVWKRFQKRLLHEQHYCFNDLLDLLLVEILFEGLEEEINSSNPLIKLIDFSPERRRNQRLDKRSGR